MPNNNTIRFEWEGQEYSDDLYVFNLDKEWTPSSAVYEDEFEAKVIHKPTAYGTLN